MCGQMIREHARVERGCDWCSRGIRIQVFRVDPLHASHVEQVQMRGLLQIEFGERLSDAGQPLLKNDIGIGDRMAELQQMAVAEFQ